MWLQRLPLQDVSGLTYDARQGRILASSRGSDFIYAINAKSFTWTWQRTGFPLFLVRQGSEGLLAASLTDGVLAEHAPAQEQTNQSMAGNGATK